MISGLKIGNFKAFGPVQDIPLAPITLVFGPNSSGKSSIIQSLLLLRHIHDTGNVDAYETSLGGKAVDLGGFAKYVHRREVEREVMVQVDFQMKGVPTGCPSVPELNSMSSKYFLRRMDNGDSVLSEVNPDFDADPGYELRSWRFVLQSGNRYEIPLWRPGEGPEAGDLVRDELPDEIRTIVADFHREHFSSMRQQLAEAHFRLEGLGLIPGNPLPRENEYASGSDPEIPKYVEDDPIAFFEELWGVDPEDALAVFDRYKIECLLELMNRRVSDSADSFSYLGPLRWMPPRVVSLGGEPDIASGEFAWSQLMNKPDLLEKVNRHLAGSIRADFRLECRRLSPLPSTDEVDRIVRDAMAASSEPEEPEARVAEEPDHDALQARLAQELTERLKSKSGDPVFELTIVDNTTGLAVSHRDVGTGISQLLPVLVHAASQKEQLIMIEQPELHLHPKLQADLGDVFRDSALGENKNTFLIETHSEHLILRLLRRIRETTGGQHGDAPPVRPDDVALLYVEPREEGAVVHRLRVDEHGRLIDPCPGGFFEEDFDEVF